VSTDHELRLEDYLGRLYGYAMSLSQNHDDSKDLVQECALKALGARNIPTQHSAYRAWLFRILRNAFIDKCRRRKVAETWVTDGTHLSSDNMEYFRGDERLINALSVKFELAKLPTAQREIIGLIDAAGLSYEEAAELLNVPIGTVMSRISRARHALVTAINGSNVQGLPVKRRT
jgi:RNA polymerase sigma-70 factor, ECF subfamily